MGVYLFSSVCMNEYLYLYIYIYIYVCVCVCVMKERDEICNLNFLICCLSCLADYSWLFPMAVPIEVFFSLETVRLESPQS